MDSEKVISVLETTRLMYEMSLDDADCDEDSAEAREGNEETIEAINEAIKALKADRWIPVSERLPDDRRVVEVTAYWHEAYQVMQGQYFGSSYCYSDGEWWCVPFNNTGEHTRILDVIAWKESAEPYKGASE